MEMKKSYSPFGSTPLSVDEVLPDIQTGRAVYPDKDKEADASYMERINQYKHEGFHDVSEDGGSSGDDASSGGGGGTSEPFVLEKVSEESSIRFNKTFGEIKEAFNSGKSIWVLDAIFEEGNMYAPIDAIGIGIAPNGGGSVVVGNANYIADTDQDYPSKGR